MTISMCAWRKMKALRGSQKALERGRSKRTRATGEGGRRIIEREVPRRVLEGATEKEERGSGAARNELDLYSCAFCLKTRWPGQRSVLVAAETQLQSSTGSSLDLHLPTSTDTNQNCTRIAPMWQAKIRGTAPPRADGMGRRAKTNAPDSVPPPLVIMPMRPEA
jgi:hypothetical protein